MLIFGLLRSEGACVFVENAVFDVEMINSADRGGGGAGGHCGGCGGAQL